MNKIVIIKNGDIVREDNNVMLFNSFTCAFKYATKNNFNDVQYEFYCNDCKQLKDCCSCEDK